MKKADGVISTAGHPKLKTTMEAIGRGKPILASYNKPRKRKG